MEVNERLTKDASSLPIELLITVSVVGHDESVLVIGEILPIILMISSNDHIRYIGNYGLHLAREVVPTFAVLRMQIVRYVT